MIARALATESGLNFIAIKVLMKSILRDNSTQSEIHFPLLNRDLSCSVSGWVILNEQ